MLATDRQFLLHIFPQRCLTRLSLLADTERADNACLYAWSLPSFVTIFPLGALSHVYSVASETVVGFFIILLVYQRGIKGTAAGLS